MGTIKPVLLCAALLVTVFIFSAAFAQNPPVSTQKLARKLPDAGHVMPLYTAAMISRVCASPKFQAEIGKSKADCAKALYKIRRACMRVYQAKFPRADNEKIDGRLDHQSFATGYMQCLKDQYARQRSSGG